MCIFFLDFLFHIAVVDCAVLVLLAKEEYRILSMLNKLFYNYRHADLRYGCWSTGASIFLLSLLDVYVGQDIPCSRSMRTLSFYIVGAIARFSPS